jgi:2,3-bisphosphoglycerate-dependent phosphoglycerate mutase
LSLRWYEARAGRCSRKFSRVVNHNDTARARRGGVGQLLKEPTHSNTIRALIKYLDRVSDGRIPALEVPTGIPLVYELDKNLAPRARYYLGDSVAAREAQKELLS